MGHYWHCCRVKALSQDDAEGAVNQFLDDQTEIKAIDYGYIMAITDENGIVNILHRDFQDDGEMFTLEKLRETVCDGLPDLQTGIDKLKECVARLSMDNIKDEIGTLDNLMSDVRNGISLGKREHFDVFKDEAFSGNLLEFGITDLNEEGYAWCDDKDAKDLHTYFVWTNCHM